MKAPETISLNRLTLRRPRIEDAEGILLGYAGDPAVTRYLTWPTHKTIEDTRKFVASADSEWIKNGVGPYLAQDADSRILGSAGLMLETPYRASLGYCVARQHWGRGYATEITEGLSALAGELGIIRIYAMSHPENIGSIRVLEKCGFDFEGRVKSFVILANLDPNPVDMLLYARILPRVDGDGR